MAAANEETQSDDKSITDYDKVLDELQKTVENLCIFQVKEVEDANASVLQSSLIERVNRTEKLFKEAKVNNANQRAKAKYWYLLGRLYNILPERLENAIEALGKAVKLDPMFIDAWNDLGECYWQIGDVGMARSCFEGALNKVPNKISLRNLSIAMRKEPTRTVEENMRNIQIGIGYAKKAIEMDPSDSTSWVILGNAYLSGCFALDIKSHSISQALVAYKQAERLGGKTPELFYNRGVALKFDEKYLEALEAFSRAGELGPTWDMPKMRKAALKIYLDGVQSSYETKGKLKIRKLQTMKQALSVGSGKEYHPLARITIDEMTPLSNDGKILVGKVVWSNQIDETFPFTFGLMDKNEDCVVVTVYNLATGKGVIIGDTVGIPDPSPCTFVKFSYEDKAYTYKKIRVNNPINFYVNGKKVPPSFRGSCQLTTRDIK